MGVEGRSWDSAVFTAISHTWSLINRRGVSAAILTSTTVAAFYNLKLATLVGSLALCWLQQCLFGCCSYALQSSPSQPNWSPVTLTGTKGRKACGTLSPSPAGNFGQSPITGATTSPNGQCHNFTWSHFWRRAFLSPLSLSLS